MEALFQNFESYLHGTPLMAVPAAYIGGVLVSFTPCVYPVAPVIVAYIGAGGGKSKSASFLLSLLYVLGMAAVYSALGVVSALTGQLFGSIQASFWTYFVFANICILLGLNMLDVFQIPLPQFLARPRETSRRGYLGSFLVGAGSGLVMGPCTTPVLAVLLGFVAAKQNVIFGMALLFAFSLGMGTLLLVLGTFSGILASLPRSGMWMVSIKKAFGFVLVAMGEYFLLMAGGV